MLEKLFQPGQRKLLMTLVTMGVTLFAPNLGVTLTPETMDLIAVLVVAFVGGNAAEHFADAIRNRAASAKQSEVIEVDAEPPSAPVDFTEVHNRITGLENAIKDYVNTNNQVVGKQNNNINFLISKINQLTPRQPAPQGPAYDQEG